MKVRIKRIKELSSHIQTLGELFIYDNINVKVYSCKTIELGWNNNERRKSCIPDGSYKVVKRVSPKFGNHFHVLNVPKRDWILIHSANFSRQLLGCVAVGKDHVDIDKDGLKDVTSSKDTMNELNNILPKEFNLEIVWDNAIEDHIGNAIV
jgi:hypothetical protein